MLSISPSSALDPAPSLPVTLQAESLGLIPGMWLLSLQSIQTSLSPSPPYHPGILSWLSACQNLIHISLELFRQWCLKHEILIANF